MKPFTVVFSHDLPLNKGVGQYLCTLEIANSEKEAADQCIRSLGGYGTIILVFDGHHTPVLREQCNVWDNQVPYKTKEVFVPLYGRESINPAQILPEKVKRITRKRDK